MVRDLQGGQYATLLGIKCLLEIKMLQHSFCFTGTKIGFGYFCAK
jgi:hypothetical protein